MRPEPNADSLANGYCYCHSDTNGHCDLHTNCNCNCDCDCNVNGDTDTNAYRKCPTSSNSNRDSYGNIDAYGYCYRHHDTYTAAYALTKRHCAAKASADSRAADLGDLGA